MKNKEYITAIELKKLLKLFITLDIELRFYISYTCNYITIDRYDNHDPKYSRDYYFKHSDFCDILEHIQAYSRLYKHNLHII